MLVNQLPCPTNDARYFIVSMQHEGMKDVQAAALASYVALRRTKQAYEAKLLEIEQKIEV
jgi:hypothetical protein